MSGNSTLYRGLLVIFGVFAVGAVVMGSVGLYVVLTGGTTSGEPEVDVLGEFACEEFENDPVIAHSPAYEVERTVLSATEIESFEAEETASGYRYNVTATGELLETSARRANRTELPVEQNGSRLVIETDGPTRFRLWVDTIAEESTVTRTRLEICPPA